MINDKLKFLITDDHELIVKGISGIINRELPDSIIVSASSGEEALSYILAEDFHFLITDISMKGMSGIDLCKIVKEKYPDIKIIVVTQHGLLWTIQQLYKIGVNGFILKEDAGSEIIAAIQCVVSGNNYYTKSINEIILKQIVNRHDSEINQIILTDREQDIIKLISQEYTTKEISEKLFISVKTVETHRNNLFIKFDVKNAVGLIKKALQLGFID
jgi:DNA-binding NarL/FixJ family response regulator